MKYVLNTAWEHANLIDQDQMHNNMHEDDRAWEKGVTVQWF